MHCVNCGNKIKQGEKFCTRCGKKVVKVEELLQSSRKKKWHWKTIVLTIFLTSFFWFIYYFGYIDKSSESANLVGHLIETVGRQQQAWEKSETVTDLMRKGISVECLEDKACVDEVIDRIKVLKVEISKESTEIDNLWAESVIGLDFESYLSSLEENDQIKLMDILDIYFPEDLEELETTNQLL